MSGTEKDEPYNDVIEEVYIGTNYCGHRLDVIVTFDSRTGGFDAEFGYIVGRIPQRITRGTTTTLTVLSNRGNHYVINRKPGGVYEALSWFTWIDVIIKKI